MSGTTCSPSESSSGCGAPAAFPVMLRDSNAFSFTTQPIVYYAEVPELYNKKQKCHDKKNKPKHFLKAFRWYMHEHGTTKNTMAAETHDIGFAAWLDNKYQQYLRDKSREASLVCLARNVETPTAAQDVVLQKSAKPKGLRRVLRSPWRKRPAQAIATTVGGGHGCAECKGSWQTILKPKSLSHFGSENSDKKRSVTCGASSKLTFTSSDTQVITNTSQREHLGVVGITTHSDNVSNINKNISVDDTTKKIDESHRTSILFRKYSTNPKYRFVCECPVEETTMTTNYKTDTNTQCDAKIKEDENSAKKVSYTHVPSKSEKLSESVTPNATKNACACSSSDVNAVLKNKNIDVKSGSPIETRISNFQRERYKNDEESKPLKAINSTHNPVKRDFTNKTSESEVLQGRSKNESAATSDDHIQLEIVENKQTTMSAPGQSPVPYQTSENSNAQQIDENKVNEKHEEPQKPSVCRCPPVYADYAAQTSDYAIIPAHVTCGHPLLLRIIPTKE